MLGGHSPLSESEGKALNLAINILDMFIDMIGVCDFLISFTASFSCKWYSSGWPVVLLTAKVSTIVTFVWPKKLI